MLNVLSLFQELGGLECHLPCVDRPGYREAWPGCLEGAMALGETTSAFCIAIHVGAKIWLVRRAVR